MKSFEVQETVPQHLQLVQVVQFYQKLQSLLAGPKKWNQEKKNKSVFLSFAGISLEIAAFNWSAVFPSTAVRSLPWGALETLNYPQEAPAWFWGSAGRSCALGPPVALQ